MNSHAVINDPSATESTYQSNTGVDAQTLIVCVDESATSDESIPHALSIARALRGNVTLARVIEPTQDLTVPFDPIEWDIRRREAQLQLDGMAKRHSTPAATINTVVLEGRSAEQIGTCIRSEKRDVAVLCRRDDKQPWHLGDTTRRIIEQGNGSVLIVPVLPVSNKNKSSVSFSRVLVPLDGSARAESAIPTALRIATDQSAELLLLHAMRNFEFPKIGPIEEQDAELQQRVNQRIERSANIYLEKLSAKLSQAGLVTKTQVIGGDDERRILIDASSVKDHDLIVLSSHGSSGYCDVPTGEIANFILSRSKVPVLMVREPGDGDTQHIFSETKVAGIRFPEGSTL